MVDDRRVSATFASPEGFDVDALANVTEKSLQLLAPLCLSSIPSEHTFAKDLIARVREYAQAIDLSVVAAQSGFTVAEEAMSLGDLIPTSTEKEHESYLIGMYELARDGHSNAAQTLQTFRDVRKKVLELLEKVRPEHKMAMIDFSIHVDGRMTPMTKPFGALHSELHDGVGDLEQFANHIDAFATWWNWMKMEANAQETRTQLIQFNYDSLRLKSVIKKWGDLRQQFATYTSKISHIQDCYPTLFVKSLSARQMPKRDGRDRGLSIQQENEPPVQQSGTAGDEQENELLIHPENKERVQQRETNGPHIEQLTTEGVQQEKMQRDQHPQESELPVQQEKTEGFPQEAVGEKHGGELPVQQEGVQQEIEPIFQQEKTMGAQQEQKQSVKQGQENGLPVQPEQMVGMQHEKAVGIQQGSGLSIQQENKQRVRKGQENAEKVQQGQENGLPVQPEKTEGVQHEKAMVSQQSSELSFHQENMHVRQGQGNELPVQQENLEGVGKGQEKGLPFLSEAAEGVHHETVVARHPGSELSIQQESNRKQQVQQCDGNELPVRQENPEVPQETTVREQQGGGFPVPEESKQRVQQATMERVQQESELPVQQENKQRLRVKQSREIELPVQHEAADGSELTLQQDTQRCQPCQETEPPVEQEKGGGDQQGRQNGFQVQQEKSEGVEQEKVGGDQQRSELPRAQQEQETGSPVQQEKTDGVQQGSELPVQQGSRQKVERGQENEAGCCCVVM